MNCFFPPLLGFDTRLGLLIKLMTGVPDLQTKRARPFPRFSSSATNGFPHFFCVAPRFQACPRTLTDVGETNSNP